MTPEGLGAVRATMRRVERSVSRVSWKDPEDAVQEAAARAVQRGIDLQAEPWLKTVAKRVAIDGVRRKREIASGAPGELEKFVREHDGNPEGVMLRAERSAEVQRALSSISPRYRSALVAYMEEESPAGVARKLGLSPNATWTLLSRARSSMRTALERAGFTPVVIFVRDHWRAIVTGTAAAGVAASVALFPTTKPQIPPTPRAVVAAAAPSPLKVTVAKELTPRVVTTSVSKLVGQAQDAVNTVTKKVDRYQVTACAGPLSKTPVIESNTRLQQDGSKPGFVMARIPRAVQRVVLQTCR